MVRVLGYAWEAMIKRDWMSTWKWSIDGALDAETLFITEFTPKRETVSRRYYL